jgi:hypothetical protein
MINPLQAMQAARASNQNRASAIQPTGAVNQSQNLQRQQLNTGQIGTRMDGPAPQMLLVDPNLYADRKQQRDFTALNQERTRQATAQQNQIKNQQALAGEELRYKNAIDTAKQTDQLNRQTILDAEARAVLVKDRESKDKLEQAKALQILKDDQFADLRGPAGSIFQRKNAWDQGAGLEYQKETYSQLLNQQAYALGDPAIRKAWVDEQNAKLGPNQTSRFTEQDLKVDSPEYTSTAMKLLRGNANFATIEAKAQKDASAATYAMSKQIDDSFNATLASITRLGYSPSVDSNAVRPQFPVSVDRDSGLLVPPMEPIIDDTATNSPNSPYISTNLLNLAKDGLGEINLDPATTLGVGTAGYVANALTAQGENKVDEVIKNAEIPKGSINNRKPISEVPLNDLEKSKIDAFKKVAASTGAKVPKDIDILKMNSSQIKDHVMDTRKTILGRVLKRVGKSSTAGKYLKGALKGVGVIGAGILAHDLATAITPQEKKAIESTNELIKIQNAPSDSNTTKSGVGWKRSN